MTTDGAPRAEATESTQRHSTPHATRLQPSQDADTAADQVSRPGASRGPPQTQRQVPPEPVGFQPVSDDLDPNGVSSHLPIVQREEMKRTPRAAAAAATAHMAEQAIVEDAPFNVVVARAMSAQHAPKPAADTEKEGAAVEEKQQLEQPSTRPSRAAAAAANAHMAEQAKEEEAPLGVVMAKALSERKPAVEQLKKEALAPVVEQPNRRPSRAAAAAANAVMAEQVKEEKLPLGVLVVSAMVGPAVEEQSLKKRPTDLAAAPAAKRSRVAATAARKQARYNTLEDASAGLDQSPRGKKRRQAPVYEAAPIITDLPPLPFTSSSPDAKGKGKGRGKPTAKARASAVDGDGARSCEFCKKVANICVLMHCHACRRVYHAQCLWHAFRPYVDEQVAILDQMERLQLEAPERRGNIFRCASCKAAFLDFSESGGFLWECDCPTCSQPEKLAFYRQRKLVQMMNDMELEKQRKRDQKGHKTTPSPVPAGKPPAPAPSRSNSSSRNRRARGSSATPDQQAGGSRTSRRSTSRSREARAVDKETDAAKTGTMEGVDGGKSDTDKKGIVKMEARVDVALVKPEQTKDTVKYEPVGEPEQLELSGDDLVGAVRLQRDSKSGGWCFLVMCSRTSSLRESGVMKTGKCKWFPKKAAAIECHCCDKMFSYAEFVHHTDSRLVKDAKCAQEDPMPFLFVEHRDNTQYSPIEKFLPALRSWATRQSLNNTPTKSRRSQAVKEPVAAALTPAMTMTNPEAAAEALPAALSRLKVLALFKRPKSRSGKTSVAARLSYPSTFAFVAQVVCLSPKYVMNMANGSLADRVVSSRTPVPDDSFPRKAGWLAFNRTPATSRHITCVCCEKDFNLDDFVAHAGVTLSEHKMKARQVLYVVERQDESALVPFNTFLPDLELVVKNGLDAFLDTLQVPPPSPRPI